MCARLHRRLFVGVLTCVPCSLTPCSELSSKCIPQIALIRDMRSAAQVLAVGDFLQLPPVELARTDFAFNSW